MDALEIGITIRIFLQPAHGHQVRQCVYHPCICRLPVAPGPAGFLVISLHAGGQIEMNDKTHIRLIDPHSKGNRGHDHPGGIKEKPALMLSPL